MRKRGDDAMMAQPLQTQAKDVAIRLAQCRLDDDRDMILAAAWAVLSAAERARAERFHFDRDRHRYVRGRGFLRQQLGQMTGQGAADLLLSEGAWGKPVLQDHALWFNLSHSRDLAVLAISQDGPVGIDLEFIDRSVDVTALARAVFCPQEIDILMALPPLARPARFFAFWTAKEARMKLTGEGMALAPQAIALDLVAGLPVGYLRPEDPGAQALFVDLGTSGAMCCLALPQGKPPGLTLLNNGGPAKKQGHHVTQ
jgi:4'-phosphopantetheinyl transferase